MFLILIWLVGAVMSWPIANKYGLEADSVDEYAINGTVCLMWPLFGLAWAFGWLIKQIVTRITR